MKTLQELCAMAILKSAVNQDEWSFCEDGNAWPLIGHAPYMKGAIARCACDFYKEDDIYTTDHTTKEFISLLPLPETVKDFMNEIAKRICQDHPPWTSSQFPWTN